MYDTHSMEETKDGLLLSHKMVVTGLLKFLWIKLVAQNVFNDVPKEMEELGINEARLCREYFKNYKA